ncbi:MAG: NAD(P)-binding domain-containing protein [Saprospiraceae bacterium]|nr:NAD(P)-binding domain-containing protein [Saprospiraceae bacterium]
MTIEKPKVLITDSVHKVLIEGLSDLGFSCDYMPSITLNEVLTIIHKYEGIVVNSKIIVDRLFLDKALRLKFIGRLGSGLEIIDLNYARKKNVVVLRSPDGNCDAVAEHVMGMLLALAINLKNSDAELRNKIWNREKNRGWEVKNKTIGILGFGYTGSAFARRLEGFGANVLAYDKYKSNYATDYPYVKETTIEQIFNKVDVLSLHLPSTEETKGLVDSKFFEKFAKPIVLINSSRGNIVCTADLLDALDSGLVSGACLDVFENEKADTYTDKEEFLYKNLFRRDNVLLTPHVAGWTVESKERLAKLLLDRIRKL